MSKRGINESIDGPDPHEMPGPKRRKVRSCLTCRKQKARCEFTSSVDVCHRCTVLNIPCVFEADAHANLLSTTASSAQASTSRSSQGTSARIETANQLGSASSVAPGQRGREMSVEDRLSRIEEALTQVLSLAGLPSLDSISAGANGSRGTPPVPPSGALASETTFSNTPRPLQNGTHNGHAVAARNLPRREKTVYPTPVELGYISQAQSTELTAIFEMRYNHCVYTPILKSHRMTVERPFTFTVMCALALRLKTNIPNQDMVHEQISRLLESHFRTAMGARPHSVDAIHAFLLMSLWSSVLVSNGVGQEATIPDGWLLLSTAIRMAQSLRLDCAAEELNVLAHQDEGGSQSHEIALERARVWYTLVTYDLAMSVGLAQQRLISGPDSSQSRILINSFARSPSDQCLAYHLDALLLVHRIHNIPPPATVAQVSQFASEIEVILRDFKALSRTAQKSNAIRGENQALCTEYRMFCLYEQYCECVCLSKACEVLSSPPFGPPMTPAKENDPSLEEDEDLLAIATFVFPWIDQLCFTAKNVIDEAFPPNSNNSTFLSTAPDHMFTVIAFCAGMLIQSQMTMLRYCSDGLTGAERYDAVVMRASSSLAQLVLSDSQLPRRYSQAILTMREKWKIQNHRRDQKRTEDLQKRAENGGLFTNDTGPTDNANLLVLAAASMEREGAGPASTIPPPNCELLPLHNASGFLDPSTWLQDVSLDWYPHFNAEAHQPTYGS